MMTIRSEFRTTRHRDLYRALSTGVVVDLAQPLENGMPCSPSHPGFRMALAYRHGDGSRAGVAAPGEVTGAAELIVTGGHVGTHLDALCHAALGGRLHGGHDALAASRGGRFTVHGVETVPPLICRGVLADIPRLLGLGRLPPEYGITATHLRDALAQHAVRAGEVVLVRTGWPQLYADPAGYVGRDTGAPGLVADAARFLAGLGVRAVGIDTVATDRILAGRERHPLPVHGVLLVEHGVYVIEVLDLEELARLRATEFLFVALPLKITGATGSPVRPVAVLPADEEVN